MRVALDYRSESSDVPLREVSIRHVDSTDEKKEEVSRSTSLSSRELPPAMRFCGQFWLLTWKNIRVIRRSLGWTLIEIVCPLFFLAILILLLKDAGSKRSESWRYDSFTLNGTQADLTINARAMMKCQFLCQNFSNYKFLYTSPPALHEEASLLMDAVATRLDVTVQWIDWQKFEAELRSDSINKTDPYRFCGRKYWGGAKFTNIDKDAKMIDYALWVSTFQSLKLSLQYLGNNPFDYSKQGGYTKSEYCSTGVLTYQIAIDNEFAKPSARGERIVYKPLPIPPYTEYMVTMFLPFTHVIFVLIITTVVMHTARDVSAEKESGMKDFLMVMGMGRRVFFASHIFISFAKAAIGVIINCIPIIIALPIVNPCLLVLCVLFYAIAMISIASAVAALTRNSSTAVKAMILVLMFLLVLSSYSAPREHVFLCHLWALNPVTGLSLGFSAITEALMRGQTLGVLNMFSEASYAFPIGSALLMLFVDAVLYFFLAIFLDWISSSSDSPVKTIARFFNQTSPLNRTSETRTVIDGADEVDLGLESMVADIQVNTVSKKWPSGERAVDALDMKCYRGQVTVLLGHNGAGKSTTFNMISGLTPPTDGSIEICGHNLARDLAQCQQKMGYCPQSNAIFTKLTVHEHLEFFARLRGVERGVWEGERAALCRDLKLDGHSHTLSMNLSGGMKRKLCVAMALIGQNQVILLDEPTAGMDTGARRDIETLLKNFKRDRTILMTTHYTDEAEQLGDRIIIMAKGNVICSGTPQFLKKKFGTGYILTLAMSTRNVNKGAQQTMAVVDRYVRNAFLSDVHGQQVEVTLPKEHSRMFPPLFKELEEQKEELGISSFGLSLNTLEQVFLKVGELAEKDSDTSTLQAAMRDIVHHGSRGAVTSGGAAWAQQLMALLKKRLCYTRQHLIALIPQFVVPIILIWLVANLMNLLFSSSSQAMKMNLGAFGDVRIGVFELNLTAEERDRGRRIIQQYSGAQEYDIPSRLSIDDWSLSQSLSRPPFLGGVAGSGPSPASIQAVFSSTFIHSVPAITNFVNSLRFNAKISMDLHELNLQNEATKAMAADSSEIVKSVLCGPLLVVIFSLLTSPFVTFPIVDRTSNFAHQQLLTGVSPVLFWFSNVLFDFCFYAFGCLTYVVMFYTVGIMAHSIPSLIVLWICFFCSSIFFIYTVSFIMDSPSKGHVLLFTYQILITLVAFAIYMLARFDIVKMGGASEVIQAIFLMTCPTFSLALGGFLISFNNLIPTNLMNLDEDPRSQDIRSIFSAGGLWSWNNLGRVVFYMLLFAVLSCLLFIAFQFKSVRRRLSQLWNIRSSLGGYSPIEDVRPNTTLPDCQGEDPEVANERVAIQGSERLPLAVNGLTKCFGKNRAVDRLSFGVRRRECFGLLGVNGAGKTSTFNVITGVAFPTAGSVRLDGVDVANEVSIGYCPQFDALLSDLTGRQVLEILAALHGYKDVRRKVDAVLRVVAMQQHADKLCRNYSGGQRRKISVGVSILAHASLIILDEPTAGIDPKARREIWQLLVSIRDGSNTALLLTSHSMDECEALCSRIGILHKGRLVALGTSQALKSKFGNMYIFTLVIRGVEGTERAMNVTKKCFPNSVIKSGQGTQTLLFEIPREPNDLWSSVFARAVEVADELDAVDFCLSQSSLEDTFLRLSS